MQRKYSHLILLAYVKFLFINVLSTYIFFQTLIKSYIKIYIVNSKFFKEMCYSFTQEFDPSSTYFRSVFSTGKIIELSSIKRKRITFVHSTSEKVDAWRFRLIAPPPPPGLDTTLIATPGIRKSWR